MRQYWRMARRVAIFRRRTRAIQRNPAMTALQKTAAISQSGDPHEQPPVQSWRNRARFARLRMKERDPLSDASHRGVWEITPLGREYLAQADEKLQA